MTTQKETNGSSGSERMLDRALGEERVPIFFSEKTIPADEHSLGGAEFEVEFRHVPRIIRNNGQPIAGSWFLIHKETLQELQILLAESQKEENHQTIGDYWERITALEKMVKKALEG